jgi:hypothetical protein
MTDDAPSGSRPAAISCAQRAHRLAVAGARLQCCMVVAAASAQKAKLQAKGKLRPHKMVREFEFLCTLYGLWRVLQLYSSKII